MKIVISSHTLKEIVQRDLHARYILYNSSKFGLEIFCPFEYQRAVEEHLQDLVLKKKILDIEAKEILIRIFQQIQLIDVNDYQKFIPKASFQLTHHFQKDLNSAMAVVLATNASHLWDSRENIFLPKFVSFQITTTQLWKHSRKSWKILSAEVQQLPNSNSKIVPTSHPDDGIDEIDAEPGFTPEYVKWVIKYEDALRSGLDASIPIPYNELPLLENIEKVIIYNFFEWQEGYVLLEEHCLKKEKVPKFYWYFFITPEKVAFKGYKNSVIYEYGKFDYQANSDSNKEWTLFWKGEKSQLSEQGYTGEKSTSSSITQDRSLHMIIQDELLDEMIEGRQKAIQEYYNTLIHASETIEKFGFAFPKQPETSDEIIQYFIRLEEKSSEDKSRKVTVINGSYVSAMTTEESRRRRILLNRFDPDRKERFKKKWNIKQNGD